MPSIFITGAAKGIGKATALLFAKKGWFVGLYDIDEAALLALHQEIGIEQSCFNKLDVCDEEQVKQAIEHFASFTQNKMNVLLNNAGVLSMGFFENIALEKQKKMIDVNIWGIVLSTFYALPLLKNTPNSQVINLSSASAIYGVPEFCVYAATKHAVRGFTEGLEIELSRYNIRVSDIMPPFVNTDMLKKAEYKAWSVEAMGVHLQADEVAKVIWKATQSHQTHHIITLKLKLLNLLGTYFPFLKKKLMKKLTMPPK
ncbi:MAG: SDR family oxidoreductase [Raineya sp.]